MMTFRERCYRKLRRVPKGMVTTYGQLATAAGSPGAARAVGSAMRHNPDAPTTPCHRVVRSDGSVGQYAYGIGRKIAILRNEGVQIENGMVKDFKKRLFRFQV